MITFHNISLGLERVAFWSAAADSLEYGYVLYAIFAPMSGCIMQG